MLLFKKKAFSLFLYFFLQIYGWNPEPYKIDELPDDMPESLKTYINETEDLKQEQKEGMVWFSCEGENPADKEHIGHIDYLPKPGVPKFHYPYTNQDGYHSPAVFAHFTNPKRKSVELKMTEERTPNIIRKKTSPGYPDLALETGFHRSSFFRFMKVGASGVHISCFK